MLKATGFLTHSWISSLSFIRIGKMCHFMACLTVSWASNSEKLEMGRGEGWLESAIKKLNVVNANCVQPGLRLQGESCPPGRELLGKQMGRKMAAAWGSPLPSSFSSFPPPPLFSFSASFSFCFSSLSYHPSEHSSSSSSFFFTLSVWWMSTGNISWI